MARTLSRLAELYHDRPYIPLGVVALCLAAAACFAASSVLQQREASLAPQEMGMRLGLIGHLIRRPLWLLGNLADVVGFGLQFLALRSGSLALVQPLLVLGLLFALAGGAWMEHRRLTRPEVGWAAMTMAGLALFLAISQPGRGSPRGSTLGWLLLGGATLALVGTLIALASGGSARRRGLCLGLATGVLLGVLAALTEATAHRLNHGVVFMLSSWQPYALIGTAVTGLLIGQSAFAAGALRFSLPALTVIEPPVAILIGQLLFKEHIRLAGLAPLGEVAGLVLMALGVVGLSRAVVEHDSAVPVAAAES